MHSLAHPSQSWHAWYGVVHIIIMTTPYHRSTLVYAHAFFIRNVKYGMGHGTLNKLHRKLELKIFTLRAVKERKNKYARKFILMKYVFFEIKICV